MNVNTNVTTKTVNTQMIDQHDTKRESIACVRAGVQPVQHSASPFIWLEILISFSFVMLFKKI